MHDSMGCGECLALTPPPKKILSLEPPKFFLAKIGKFGQFAVKFHVTPPPLKFSLDPSSPRFLAGLMYGENSQKLEKSGEYLHLQHFREKLNYKA